MAHKRALMVAMTTGVLLLLLALASGVLAELITYDFTGKVAGSTVENANIAYSFAAATPDESPSAILTGATEFSQADYDGVEVDDTTYAASLAASGAWVEVGSGSATGGGISDSSGFSYNPSLGVDGSGNPYVAWSDVTGGNEEIYIKKFDGSSWVEVGSSSATDGGISDTSGWSYGPSVGVDGSGNPYVAWYDSTSGNSEIYVKRYDGADWVEVGSGSASGGGISDDSGASQMPSLALDASANPYVAWYDYTGGDCEIYIKRFDGADWVEVGSGSASGGGISDSGSSQRPSLALDGSGNPYVAWLDNTSGNYEVYVKRFDEASWVEVGSGSASGSGISDTGSAYEHVSLALDGSGNPYVAWADGTYPDCEIYIKRFDGTGWVEVGSGSATGGGISDNSGWSGNPSLVLDGSGNPCVTWSDNTIGIGNAEIYMKRYDGANWVEVGTGSASGGGISQNSLASYRPSLALDRLGNPYVAWYDYTSGNPPSDIYVKRVTGKYAEHLYSVYLSEGTIDQIAPSVLAYGTAARDGATVQIWNNAISAWESVGSNSDSSMPATPITATLAVSANDYVDSANKVYLMVRTTYLSNISTPATLYVDYVSLEVDYESLPRPSGTISINRGASDTTSPNVLLDLWSDGATYMRFSNDGNTYTHWDSYDTSKWWTLSSGDGEKTVYVEYRDASVASAVYTDTINLDSSVGSEYGVSINDGALFTNQITVTLSLGAPAYTAQMMVSNDGGFAGATWEPCATHREWQITQYGAYVIPRTVYVKYKDTEGTISSTYQDDIILDVNPPTGSVEIVPGVGSGVGVGSSGGVATLSDYPHKIFLPLVSKTSPNVTLLLSASDDVSGVGYMSMANDPSLVGVAWEPYASSKPWRVNEPGTTTVYVKYRDNAGNVSEVYSDTITL